MSEFPESNPEPLQAITGQLVTETFQYDGGRPVTVYIPALPAELIVFAGDGQLVSQWGKFLEEQNGPSTMIVGVHRASDEMDRLHEYSPTLRAERFASHERFFVEEVGSWVRSHFGVRMPSNRTAMVGVSAGGELSLALGLRHPDLYGIVFSASPGGGYQPPDPMPVRLPRTYLVAGRQEPYILENAARWAGALQEAKADVVLHERDAGHDEVMWRQEFPLMLRWALGAS